MTSQGILRGLFLAALLVAPAAPRSATAQLTDAKSTCTAINCEAKTITGTYRLDQSGRAVPFIAKIWSDGGLGNECVRVEVTKQPSDLEIVLLSPMGTFWRDDDSGQGAEPLVKARTIRSGWYTLQISSFNASGSTGNFTAKYGRYNSGNPNCNNPTLEH